MLFSTAIAIKVCTLFCVSDEDLSSHKGTSFYMVPNGRLLESDLNCGNMYQMSFPRIKSLFGLCSRSVISNRILCKKKTIYNLLAKL